MLFSSGRDSSAGSPCVGGLIDPGGLGWRRRGGRARLKRSELAVVGDFREALAPLQQPGGVTVADRRGRQLAHARVPVLVVVPAEEPSAEPPGILDQRNEAGVGSRMLATARRSGCSRRCRPRRAGGHRAEHLQAVIGGRPRVAGRKRHGTARLPEPRGGAAGGDKALAGLPRLL